MLEIMPCDSKWKGVTIFLNNKKNHLKCLFVFFISNHLLPLNWVSPHYYMKNLPKLPFGPCIINCKRHLFPPIVAFTDVTVAFNETEHARESF